MERGHSRTAARRGRDREEEYNHVGEDNVGDRAQETGPRTRPGKQRRRQGRAPREGWPWEERQRERRVDRQSDGGFGGVRNGGGRDDLRGARREQKHAAGVTMGNARKRRGRITGGCEGRREQHRESPLYGRRRGGNPRPPWGEAGVRRKNGGRWENTRDETSGVRGDDRGTKASGVAHESPGVGEEDGGCKISGVAENPGGGAPWSERGGRVASGRRHPRNG